MSDAVRIGVIGAGAIVQVAHLGVLSRLRDVELVALADIDVPTAQALAGRFDIPDVYDDIEDLLRYARPDAVAVCTPNHLHEVHVQTALAAGVHVFCERPLALSVGGVEKLIEAARGADRVLMVGMNYRYRSDVQGLLEFLRGGELGALRAIRTGWYIWRPSAQLPRWKERPAQAGGGAMFDLGLPLVDLALWVCPGAATPRRVTAWFAGGRGEAGVEDTAAALILCEGELSVFVDVSWRHVSQVERFWFDVLAAEGAGRVGPLRVFKEIHGTPVDVTPSGAQAREDALTHSYRAEWSRFVSAVQGLAEPPDLRDQVLLHRTMEAIARSAAEGRTVEL